MARGRMVNKKISNSKRVNELPLQAQLLFTWMIPHLDCNGCFYGSAQMIKSLVIPRKSWPKNKIEKWLVLMENSIDFETGLPLIKRYLVDNEKYLFMPGFREEQVGLRYDKEKPEFPTFDGFVTPSVGPDPPLSRTEVEQEQERKVEGEGSSSSLFPAKNVSNDADIVLRVYNTFEENIGKTTEKLKESIDDAIVNYTPEWVIDAIKEAAIQGQKKWAYVLGVLRNWHDSGKTPNGQHERPSPA